MLRNEAISALREEFSTHFSAYFAVAEKETCHASSKTQTENHEEREEERRMLYFHSRCKLEKLLL